VNQPGNLEVRLSFIDDKYANETIRAKLQYVHVAL
jgi:hypothetical protein